MPIDSGPMGTTPGAPSGGHYFAAHPDSPLITRAVHVRLHGRDVSVLTAGGVFSHDRLDPGTQVLLRHVPAPPPGGELLDLGCGWGPLTLSMAMAAPRARVWAVDVNERARELTRRNAAALALAQVHVVAPEAVPPDVTFGCIWSNPPIRIGKDALHALLMAWLPRLAPGASAWLVVQRNLGADSLQRWLSHQVAGSATVDRHASSKGYRVLRVKAAD